MNKPADLKPRNLSAAVRLRLNEIENHGSLAAANRGVAEYELSE